MYDQECGYDAENNPICPECGSDDMYLVSGDHGYDCNKCGATFVCP